MTHNKGYVRNLDECTGGGGVCTSHPADTNNINPHSKIINSLFWPVYASRGRGKKGQASIVFVCKWKRFSSTFPLPVKKRFSGSFELKIGIFLSSWCSPDALLSSRGTMTTLQHPCRCATVGDLGDCFGHLWISSIKMTAVFHKNAEFGRRAEREKVEKKYGAVPLDDKWPSFDWANGEMRAAVC